VGDWITYVGKLEYEIDLQHFVETTIKVLLTTSKSAPPPKES